MIAGAAKLLGKGKVPVSTPLAGRQASQAEAQAPGQALRTVSNPVPDSTSTSEQPADAAAAQPQTGRTRTGQANRPAGASQGIPIKQASAPTPQAESSAALQRAVEHMAEGVPVKLVATRGQAPRAEGVPAGPAGARPSPALTAKPDTSALTPEQQASLSSEGTAPEAVVRRNASAAGPKGLPEAGSDPASTAGSTEEPAARMIALDGGAGQSAGLESSTPTGGAASGSAASRAMPADVPGQAAEAPVATQIAETVRIGAVRVGETIVVRLNPPELGKVRLTLRADGNELRGVLEVENSRTLGELQREAPALIQRLAESGVQLRRMEINLSDQEGGAGDRPTSRNAGSGDLDQDSLPQEGEDGRQDNPAAPAGEQTPEQMFSSNADPAEGDEAVRPAWYAGDESINVWI